MAEEKALGPNTKTTLGVSVSCVIVFLSGALWINGSLTDVERAVTDLGHRIDLFDVRLKTVEERGDGNLKASTFRTWAEDLERKNPNLFVPRVQ